jgi:hypothetical protein
MPEPWPFGTDAIQQDPLTALRIPVVTSFNPQWGYIGAFLSTEPGPDRAFDPPWPFASVERPTDAEAQMLVSFIQEAKNRLRGGYVARMEERPLDVDNWSCAHVFIWGYRRLSWIYGHTFVPSPPSLRGTRHAHDKHPGPLPLEQVMDLVHTFGDDKPMQHWLDWKAAHPVMFPPAAVTAQPKEA